MIRMPVYAVSVVVGASVLMLGGAFLLGRRSAPAHNETWIEGNTVGYGEGVAAGRALQVGASLPSNTRDVATKAFQAGYRSGIADSFGGYDGGWYLGRPYVVVLGKGSGDRPYRIARRELLKPGVTFRLCQGGAAVCVG